MIEKTSPEVLIYIQNIKNYLNKNSKEKEYFIGESDENSFYNLLKDISQKNFETHGDPMLAIEQFELLRKTLKIIKISTKDYPEEKENNIFIDTEFGIICLN